MFIYIFRIFFMIKYISIPKDKYENIIKGTYNRNEKFVKNPSNRTRKKKNYL